MAVSILPGTIPDGAVLDMITGRCSVCDKTLTYSDGMWLVAADLCREHYDEHIAEKPDWCFACRIGDH